MPGRQISTAISDFFLALSAYFAALFLKSEHPLAAVGISLQGVAALIGIARFSGDPPDSFIIEAHQAFSWLATLASLPGLATGFYNHFNVPYLGYFMVILCGLAFFFSCYMEKEVRKNIAETLAGFSVLSIIMFCLYHRHTTGLLACVVYIMAGAVVGSEGSFAGIPRVDILHYTLIVGNVAFIKALT